MKTLKQKIEVMSAAAGGTKIEYITLSDPNDTWTRCPFAGDDDYHWSWHTFDYRIAQPTIVPGHNPDKLTTAQVETHLGWRLLEPDELKSRKQRYVEIEAWNRCRNTWNDDKYEGNCDENIYRTKLSREQLAALDNPPPKKRLPLGPEDFPPGTVLRWALEKTTWFAVLATSNAGVFAYRTGKVDFASIMHDGERSLDGGKTWLPCYREQ